MATIPPGPAADVTATDASAANATARLHAVAISGYVLRLRLLAEGLALADEITAWLDSAGDTLSYDDIASSSIRRTRLDLDSDEPVESYQVEALRTALYDASGHLEHAIQRAAGRRS
jgi:hypothetical protein